MSDNKPPPIYLDNTHITGKPDNPSPNGKPGGASGSWTIGFGSGGGSGFFSGGFGGSSSKKAKRRARARKRAAAQQRAEAARALAQAQAEAQAKAQAEAEAQAQAEREAAHRELIQTLSQKYSLKRGELDQVYASRLSTLTQLLTSEMLAEKKPPNSPGVERWQLYLISKEKIEIDRLTTRKHGELQIRSMQALSFNGRDPFALDVEAYRDALALSSNNNAELAHDAHSKWEAAYVSAHEAKLLSESVGILAEKNQKLSAYYIEQEKLWREREVRFQKQLEYADQREEQAQYKLLVDESSRRDLVTASNTLSASSASMAAGAVVWGRGGTLVAEGVAAALEKSIVGGLQELARIVALRAGQTLTITLSSLLYSEPLGNAELTAEQRRRLFQGVSVDANAIGVSRDVDLPAIAVAGGTAELAARIKPVPVARGIELRGVTTGGAVSANVPVISAIFEPLSGTYQAQISGALPKHLVIGGAGPAPTPMGPAGLFNSEPQISELPTGVDAGINDCIVCFPAESGLAPRYFSFGNQTPGTGIVVGSGEVATADWWKQATQGRGVAIAAQIGERVRYREFSSVEAFDKTAWRALAEDPVLGKQFDDINRKRMARGFAPYAPKASWAGERRVFEIRNKEAANDAAHLFDLDRLSIARPNSDYGVNRVAPTYLPWPVSSGSTWTPLLPPGSESLGPTDLPAAPEKPVVHPGGPTEPVGSKDETLPIADPDDINASIPGYGDDDELPSPGLVNAGPPVEPLEVGAYNDLSKRSVRDGLDIDHIVSRAALKKHILRNLEDEISPREIFRMLDRAPSLAIPISVHRKYSETYGGRNTQAKQDLDASDLRAAVDSNVNSLRHGLLEEGFTDAAIESARDSLHKSHTDQGWYK